jgi:hypothetical protein
MGNRRLYSSIGSYLVPTRFLTPMAASKIQGADNKLGQFLSQDILASANHINCVQHSLESYPSLI